LTGGGGKTKGGKNGEGRTGESGEVVKRSLKEKEVLARRTLKSRGMGAGTSDQAVKGGCSETSAKDCSRGREGEGLKRMNGMLLCREGETYLPKRDRRINKGGQGN